MKYSLKHSSGQSGVTNSLDGICLSHGSRERALAYMYKADTLMNIVIGAASRMHAAVARIERGIRKLAQRIRAHRQSGAEMVTRTIP